MVNANNDSTIKVYLYFIVLLLCLALLLLFSGCSFKQSEDKPEQDEQQTTLDTDESQSENIVDESQLDIPGETEQQDNEEVADEDETDEGIIWHNDSSWVYVDNSWLNIRGGPSTDFEILTEVYYGQALERTAVSDYWSRIVLPDGRTGYAYNSYLSLDPLEEVDPND